MIDVVMDVMMFMFDNGFINNGAADKGARGGMRVSVAICGSEASKTSERRIR